MLFKGLQCQSSSSSSSWGPHWLWRWQLWWWWWWWWWWCFPRGAMLEFSHLMLAGVQSKHAADSSWGRFCSLFSSSSTSSSSSFEQFIWNIKQLKLHLLHWCHLSNAFGISGYIYCIAVWCTVALLPSQQCSRRQIRFHIIAFLSQPHFFILDLVGILPTF